MRHEEENQRLYEGERQGNLCFGVCVYIPLLCSPKTQKGMVEELRKREICV